ncbi:hypothetical protein F2Q68_00007594 [Brassica cretica]|uniref:Uncharacterized protein n=1 Tax=Brassica cretica TaxID=69181 RepID=A0A8S9KTY2_BRACR|nr:hypothetical protein F2Q68_00007594 [Brassica cretica]
MVSKAEDTKTEDAEDDTTVEENATTTARGTKIIPHQCGTMDHQWSYSQYGVPPMPQVQYPFATTLPNSSPIPTGSTLKHSWTTRLTGAA